MTLEDMVKCVDKYKAVSSQKAVILPPWFYLIVRDWIYHASTYIGEYQWKKTLDASFRVSGSSRSIIFWLQYGCTHLEIPSPDRIFASLPLLRGGCSKFVHVRMCIFVRLYAGTGLVSMFGLKNHLDMLKEPLLKDEFQTMMSLVSGGCHHSPWFSSCQTALLHDSQLPCFFSEIKWCTHLFFFHAIRRSVLTKMGTLSIPS